MAAAAVQRIRDWLSVGWPSAVTAAAGPLESMTWLAALEVVTSRCGADLMCPEHSGQRISD
jgi:hypothetical protein